MSQRLSFIKIKNLFLERQSSKLVWFVFSLFFGFLYSFWSCQQAFSTEYIVQDDARQHVFWMQRFLVPQLFPNNWIANYFESVAPFGYTTLYRFMANIGIEPLTFNKCLPIFLTLITTRYCFKLTLHLFPVPIAGFISSLLLNQTLWSQDDLVSATPRAFAYPLLLAFWYYCLRRSRLACLGTLALQGLFYPQTVFISAGILLLQLLTWEQGKLHLSQKPSDYQFCLSGFIVAVLVMLPYALTTSEFGPIVTVTEARGMPEFWPGGRANFFDDNFWEFWFNGDRSGILPRRESMPILLYSAFLWPFLWRYPSQFPLSRRVTPGVILLPQTLLVSLSLFVLAHLLLFKLHLPSRYTQYSLRLILALAAGITLTILLDGIFRWGKPKTPFYNRVKNQQARDASQEMSWEHPVTGKVLAVGFATLIGVMLLIHPILVKEFPKTAYEVGKVPELYQFFADQPEDSLIASLSLEADNLPTFSRRSILVSREYGIPYHLGYYQPFRQHVIELLRAQYSRDLAEVQNFIQTYEVDFWLLDSSAFTPDYLARNSWLQQYQPIASQILTQLQEGTLPVLPTMIESCLVFETEEMVVLQASCLLAKSQVN